MTKRSTFPGMPALRHAVENAGTVPITDEQIVGILRGQGGHPAHVSAVFSDASLPVIAAAARSNGLDLVSVLTAYVHARADYAAANPELDEAVKDMETLALMSQAS